MAALHGSFLSQAVPLVCGARLGETGQRLKKREVQAVYKETQFCLVDSHL